MKTIKQLKKRLLSNVDSFLNEYYPIYIKSGLKINSPEKPEDRTPTKGYLKNVLIELIKDIEEDTISISRCHLSVNVIFNEDGNIYGSLGIYCGKEYK